MKIESIILREVQMGLKAPFETSFGVSHHRRIILVEAVCARSERLGRGHGQRNTGLQLGDHGHGVACNLGLCRAFADWEDGCLGPRNVQRC
jgi:hypothetical protein